MPLMCIRGACLGGIAKRDTSFPSPSLTAVRSPEPRPCQSPLGDRENCRIAFAEAQAYSPWLAWSATSVPAGEIMDLRGRHSAAEAEHARYERGAASLACAPGLC
jgi:hypothetical protein